MIVFLVHRIGSALHRIGVAGPTRPDDDRQADVHGRAIRDDRFDEQASVAGLQAALRTQQFASFHQVGIVGGIVHGGHQPMTGKAEGDAVIDEPAAPCADQQSVLVQHAGVGGGGRTPAAVGHVLTASKQGTGFVVLGVRGGGHQQHQGKGKVLERVHVVGLFDPMTGTPTDTPTPLRKIFRSARRRPPASRSRPAAAPHRPPGPTGCWRVPACSGTHRSRDRSNH